MSILVWIFDRQPVRQNEVIRAGMSLTGRSEPTVAQYVHELEVLGFIRYEDGWILVTPHGELQVASPAEAPDVRPSADPGE